MNNFSERLKELRLEKGLTQQELAQATKLSQTAIALWENNKRGVTADSIIALAEFFGVTCGYLLGVEN